MTPFEAARYLARIPEDEPVIVLRAQDRCAPKAMRVWAELAENEGVPEHKWQGMLDAVAEFEAWPNRKWPD